MADMSTKNMLTTLNTYVLFCFKLSCRCTGPLSDVKTRTDYSPELSGGASI